MGETVMERNVLGRMAGKVAVVTGGARGQGLAEAELFIAEGASVMITDVLAVDGEAAAAQLGENAAFCRHDVSDPTSWSEVINATEGRFGPITTLINNAGIHWVRAIEDEQVDALRRMIDVNLIGTFLGLQAVLPSMRRAGGGSIVNISSLAGMKGLSWHGAYGSTKWAVRGLTKTAAMEFAADGIRVNSVHPGAVDSAMLPADREGLGNARFASTLIPRAALPSEIAEMVCYLASDASAFVTGAEFVIDGGSLVGTKPTPRPV